MLKTNYYKYSDLPDNNAKKYLTSVNIIVELFDVFGCCKSMI
jgi:hypothetical protein